MNGNVFLDTNIFIYSFDHSSPQKQQIARALIENAISGNIRGMISYQIVQEFINVALKKFKIPFTHQEIKNYLSTILLPLCEIHSSFELYESALEIQHQFQYSFYDSLIIASALETDCVILYSEDLQNHQSIFNLKIENPFMTSLHG
ncbi:MAG: PIN domain-containing protein [Gammaproteobacteria bacterium]|nr:PIN domain-containing protein [Gammaproteobacteria bacterium]